MATMRDRPGTGAGRPESTSHAAIEQAAFELFSTQGFDGTTLDQIAHAVGVNRRTLFRYYPSKNAIPWGDFDAHLHHFASVLDGCDPAAPIRVALRTALLDFNSGDDFQTDRHRQRMRLILETPELQAYSMTMYAGWRQVVAQFVADRTGAKTSDLVPQTIAWLMLGVALAAYEHWLADDGTSLREALGAAFDSVAVGLP